MFRQRLFRFTITLTYGSGWVKPTYGGCSQNVMPDSTITSSLEAPYCGNNPKLGLYFTHKNLNIHCLFISRFNLVLDQANHIPMLPNYKPMVQILWSLLIFQCFRETWLIKLITFEWLKNLPCFKRTFTQLECSQWIDTLFTLVCHKH
jgi:hypothetical protein